MSDSSMDHQDPFAEILGRALIDTNYRDQLMDGGEADQIKALLAAGLSEEQARSALPELNTAVQALRDLAQHEVFGPRPFAA